VTPVKNHDRTQPFTSSQQPTPVKLSPQAHTNTGPPPQSAGPASPSLSTPGASPWKTASRSPPISFTSVQKEQSTPTLASTFPPATKPSLPPRPNVISGARSKPPPPTSKGSTSTRRSAGAGTQSPSTTPIQVRSVPGKSFQNQPQPRPSIQSPILPDMFPILGSSPQNFADIIAQQTSEQQARNAKMAPRSLKEIQEEEQFLQWWERESQRVQEEEIRIKKMAQRRRGQRGNGGRGGRGCERGRGGFDGKWHGGDVKERGGGSVEDENGKGIVNIRGG